MRHSRPPEKVGQDRLVNAWEAQRRKGNCLVIDIGTAVTIDVVSESKTFLGGVIAPGQKISGAALHDYTAQLPEIKLTQPHSVLGRSTEEAILSGLYYGMAAMIDGLVKRLKAELGGEWASLATGGGAKALLPLSENIQEIDEQLTLRGLLGLYKWHQLKK